MKHISALTLFTVLLLLPIYPQDYEYFNRNNLDTYIDFRPSIQSSPEQIIFDLSDDISENIHSKPAIYLKDLVTQLTDWTDEEHLKIKSIHDWITLNIQYDFSGYDDGNIQIVDPYITLRTKKAVCGGYATLFRAMTRMAGFDSEYITGYSRGESKYNIGTSDLVRHAWNAVKISDNWYLVDTTWDSQSEYSNHFLFTDPMEFIKSHYPRGVGWLLLDDEVTMEEFMTGDKS
jgi:transglutaminase/protease-like cytokinesis protein 3